MYLQFIFAPLLSQLISDRLLIEFEGAQVRQAWSIEVIPGAGEFAEDLATNILETKRYFYQLGSY